MRTVVNFFRCPACGEHDVDLSRMCRRSTCPKAHHMYTEVRFIERGSDLALMGEPGATVPTADNEADKT